LSIAKKGKLHKKNVQNQQKGKPADARHPDTRQFSYFCLYSISMLS